MKRDIGHPAETTHLDAPTVYRLIGPALEVLREVSPTRAFGILESM